MSIESGVLKLTIVEGKLTHDTEMIGSMSPYCTLVFNGKKYKTKVIDGGGKTPKFGDTFTFEVSSSTEEIVLRVWDKDMTKSDAVGYCKIKCSALMLNNGTSDWHTIFFDNAPAGDIKLDSVFEPTGGDQFENLKAEAQAQADEL